VTIVVVVVDDNDDHDDDDDDHDDDDDDDDDTRKRRALCVLHFKYILYIYICKSSPCVPSTSRASYVL